MPGKPSSVKPVLIWFSPGPCVLLLAVIEWTKQNSSASVARLGSRSLTILPDWPRGLNVHNGWCKFPCAPWKVTSLSPPGRGCPCRFTSSGLWSKVSRWLSAPEQKITSALFARALKCGRRGASGSRGSTTGRIGADVALASCANSDASAMPPSPHAGSARKSRRLSSGWFIGITLPRSIRWC